MIDTNCHYFVYVADVSKALATFDRCYLVSLLHLCMQRFAFDRSTPSFMLITPTNHVVRRCRERLGFDFCTFVGSFFGWRGRGVLDSGCGA